MKTTPTLATVVLLLVLCGPAATWAQGTDDSRFRAGLRLGVFEMVNAADSYDAAYGDPMPMLGLQVEWQLRPRIVLAASLDYGEIDGEHVLLSDPPRGTGIEQTLTYVPLHVTGAWRADRGGDWAWLLGAGPSFLSWESDSPLASADGSGVGGHVMTSLRRMGDGWTFGGDLRWSTFPDAASQSRGSLTRFFDEDDFGGISLHLVALRGF